MSRFKNKRSREATVDGTVDAVTVEPTPEEPSDASEAEAPPERAASVDGMRGRVGEHVESVLQAAEDAAARLVEEAEAHAKRIREDAERDAASRVDEARGTAARLTEEAQQFHSEARATADEVRATAEEEASTRRADAEEEAARLRADAERDASTFVERTAARYEDLVNDTALAEDRLRRLVGGLRDVADRLDDLLEPAEEDEPSEPTDEFEDEPDESLEEALDPKASSWTE
jgi:cell division septum initiation protein DivIVA